MTFFDRQRPFETDDDGNVKCPDCGECNLHHTEFSIFDRKEDEKTAVRIDVDGRGRVSVDPKSEETGPSPRRHGFEVRFWCEHCGDDVKVLSVFQHKGSTYLGWEETKKGEGMKHPYFVESESDPDGSKANAFRAFVENKKDVK